MIAFLAISGLLHASDYVPIDVLVRERQVTWTSDAATGRETLRGPNVRLVFVPSLPYAIWNDTTEALARPVVLREGKLQLPAELYRRLEAALPRRTPDAAAKRTVPPAGTKLVRPPVAWIPSPNFDVASRRPIRYVVLHTTEGSYAGAISWFRTEKSRVSAHYIVGLDGRVTQMVREEDVAWHAGRSYNWTTIGIEHEGYSDQNLWTAAQYRASAAITRDLCDRYRIPIDRLHIISHQSIAPDRRRDPGRYFDWELYLSLVRGDAGADAVRWPKAGK